MEDVQLAANQAVGVDACESADLDRNGFCDEVDVEHFINASLGQGCPAAQPGEETMTSIEAAGATTTVAAATISGTSVTSYGAKCDGSTNDRPAIQKAFDNVNSWTNKTLVFPAGKTCVITAGLHLYSASGWKIVGEGAKLKAANGMCLDGCGPMVTLLRVDNFTINDLDTDGNRANRSVGLSVGGHSWQILQATNGTFRNVDWVNGTTDNVRIAAGVPSLTSTFSKNLTFIDSKFSNGNRNNISVIEGWNIRFLGTCSGGFTGTCSCQITGSTGGGLDWEPNSTSASPAIDNGLVDGCLIADNRGTGHLTHAIGGSRDITVRNSINRGNGGSSGGRGAFAVDASGELIENNWIGKQVGSRFGVIYISSGRKSNTRITQVRNNFIDGIPPIGTSYAKRQVVLFGNYTDGTPSFNNNEITKIGVPAKGDWCGAFKTHNAYGNTIDGVMQGPNPGCP